MSKTNKTYKGIFQLFENRSLVPCLRFYPVRLDVTCLTTGDMIMFLQLNEKGKHVFMNENVSFFLLHFIDTIFVKHAFPRHLKSIIPCEPGILIRPKSNENTNRASTSYLNGSGNSLPSFIVNTITNEIIEIKFNDDLQRNEWLTLVHTHITPYIEGWFFNWLNIQRKLFKVTLFGPIILENLNRDDISTSIFESYLTNTTSTPEQSVNGPKNYRNQTVVYASDCQQTLTNALKSLQVNDSTRILKTQNSATEHFNHTLPYDAQMSSVYESIKDLIEQALFQNSDFFVF